MNIKQRKTKKNNKEPARPTNNKEYQRTKNAKNNYKILYNNKSKKNTKT